MSEWLKKKEKRTAEYWKGGDGIELGCGGNFQPVKNSVSLHPVC